MVQAVIVVDARTKTFYSFEKTERAWAKKNKRMNFKISHNVFALGAVADFGAKNFQFTTNLIRCTDL